MRKELLALAGGLLSNALANKNGAREKQGSIESRTVRVNSSSYDYQIYAPPTLSDAQNSETLPLIIFLHGIGQRGSSGFVPTAGTGGTLARHYLAQVPPAIILLPQCRPGSYWSDSVMDEMVMNSLTQTVEEFGADANRVYLTGVSMGGYGVWHFAAGHAGKFAALVSICGGSSVTKGERFASVAEKVGKTPAWIFHGASDKIVPVTESRELVKALKAHDNNVKYSEYADVGHNVWMNALAEKELMPWLFRQRRLD